MDYKNYIEQFRVSAGMQRGDVTLEGATTAPTERSVAQAVQQAMESNRDKWKSLTFEGSTRTFDPQDDEDFELEARLDMYAPDVNADDGGFSVELVFKNGTGGKTLTGSPQRMEAPQPVDVDRDNSQYHMLSGLLVQAFNEEMVRNLTPILSKAVLGLKLRGKLYAYGPEMTVRFEMEQK